MNMKIGRKSKNKNMMKNCAFCGSTELEMINPKHILCKRCGFGFGNTGKENPENMNKYLEQMANQIKVQKIFFPDDTDEQTVLRLSFHTHRLEKHPTTKDGYCEYCDRDWNKMSKEEFKEKLGYDKDKWSDVF
jgi:ribosomal protein L37AE/L43A